jgi:hypothetical protein
MKFITFQLPDDPELLAAFGLVALSHAHLDHMLRLMIKTLANVTVDEARLATAREGSAALRDQVRKLAKSVMGDSTPDFIKLKALLSRCRICTERRNALMHGICAQELNSDAVSDEEFRGAKVMLDEDLQMHPMPTTSDLRELSAGIESLVNEINQERRFGFIDEAMRRSRESPDMAS